MTLSSDPLDYAEIFDKIVPHADLEASGYEMKIIQTLDFDRPLDDFLWFSICSQFSNFLSIFQKRIRSFNCAKTCRGIFRTTIKITPTTWLKTGLSTGLCLHMIILIRK